MIRVPGTTVPASTSNVMIVISKIPLLARALGLCSRQAKHDDSIYFINKIPYRRARAWSLGRALARAKVYKVILYTMIIEDSFCNAYISKTDR